jgi:hypothetical protein
MIEKPTVGPLFLGAFSSDRISKATKNISVGFFIHSFTPFSNFCKFYQEVPGNFWSYQ